MPVTFKVWRSNSVLNYVAIGINVDGNKDSFYSGRLPYHETFYYNPKEKTFNPDCMNCWFPAEKLAAIKLQFVLAVLGESFQKFLGEV